MCFRTDVSLFSQFGCKRIELQWGGSLNIKGKRQLTVHVSSVNWKNEMQLWILRVIWECACLINWYSFLSLNLKVVGFWKLPLSQSTDNVWLMEFHPFLWLAGICVVKVKQNRVTLNPFFKCSFLLVYDNAFFSEMRLIIWNTSKSDY